MAARQRSGLAPDAGSSALVLTGGGARGAYEAGVLLYTLCDLHLDGGRRPRFDIVAGTSAGALNACTVAATAHHPEAGARQLAEYWRELTMERLLSFGYRELARAPELLFGRANHSGGWLLKRERVALGGPHEPVAGLFDTSPLRRDMERHIPWASLRDNVDKGRIRGVAVCATEVCTSRSVVFYDVHDPEDYRPGSDVSRVHIPVQMELDHAMASASIPFLFPSVQIMGRCYVDGALRQNTPISPALRMGADRMLVVTLAEPAVERYRKARLGCRRSSAPGVGFLLGRVVRAVMDGMVEQELRRVEMFNHFLEDGQRTCGVEFPSKLNAVAVTYRNAAFRPVRTLVMRPSRNLDAIAMETFDEAPDELRLPGGPGRMVGRILSSESALESELTSFVMFAGSYTRKLVALGYEDAKARSDELRAFFG